MNCGKCDQEYDPYEGPCPRCYQAQQEELLNLQRPTRVTQLRGGAPRVNDIVGQLRVLADNIERGELKVDTMVIVCLRNEQFAVQRYVIGDVVSRREIIGAHMQCVNYETYPDMPILVKPR
jgi:hypothetical protein